MGDFNVNLLHAESSRYAQQFLLSLQSFSFTPTIDKPIRVHNCSATLIDNELVRVSDWLNANKLTLNANKSNFVIFLPHQRKMDHSVNILMFDNSNHILTCLECKDHVKYLGVLLDSHLSWKYHIDNVALK